MPSLRIGAYHSARRPKPAVPGSTTSRPYVDCERKQHGRRHHVCLRAESSKRGLQGGQGSRSGSPAFESPRVVHMGCRGGRGMCSRTRRKACVAGLVCRVSRQDSCGDSAGRLSLASEPTSEIKQQLCVCSLASAPTTEIKQAVHTQSWALCVQPGFSAHDRDQASSAHTVMGSACAAWLQRPRPRSSKQCTHSHGLCVCSLAPAPTTEMKQQHCGCTRQK